MGAAVQLLVWKNSLRVAVKMTQNKETEKFEEDVVHEYVKLCKRIRHRETERQTSSHLASIVFRHSYYVRYKQACTSNWPDGSGYVMFGYKLNDEISE